MAEMMKKDVNHTVTTSQPTNDTARITISIDIPQSWFSPNNLRWIGEESYKKAAFVLRKQYKQIHGEE